MPKASDHAARLARLRRLCESLDDMHAQTQAICRAITIEARKANGQALKPARPRRKKKR